MSALPLVCNPLQSSISWNTLRLPTTVLNGSSSSTTDQTTTSLSRPESARDPYDIALLEEGTRLMLAIRISANGGPEVLTPTDIPTPSPGRGEILIRHGACGLNYIDIYQRSGLYPMPLPATLGLEGAGVVIAVGEGVDRFKIGDRAAYCSTLGGYAEFNVVKADRAVRVPKSISDDVAAAVMLKGLTAEFLARRIWPLVAGDTVLVHAAAGGVGLILCQWLNHLGI
eukprot:gene14555-17009_t